MAGETKEQGWLTKAFMAVGKVITIGLISAIAWQIFLDPIFFPIFHDPTNTTAQAFVSMINSTFSWIPELIGLTGDGGLLNMDFMQSILEPFMDYTPQGMAETIESSSAASFESMDDFFDM